MKLISYIQTNGNITNKRVHFKVYQHSLNIAIVITTLHSSGTTAITLNIFPHPGQLSTSFHNHLNYYSMVLTTLSFTPILSLLCFPIMRPDLSYTKQVTHRATLQNLTAAPPRLVYIRCLHRERCEAEESLDPY